MPPFGINRKYYAWHKTTQSHATKTRKRHPQTTTQTPLSVHNTPSHALARTLQRLHTNIHKALNK